MKSTLLFAFFLLLSGCSEHSDKTEMSGMEHSMKAEHHATDVEFLNSDSALPDAPFSNAVRVGNLLFMSGQIGVLPGTRDFPEGGFDAQAHQVMTNVKNTVEEFGSSMDRVVKCLVMIEDIDRWADFNAVYVQYFPGSKPARSAFGADGLALGAMFEVECIAVMP
jgi:reactive intermediate/imine deaminase